MWLTNFYTFGVQVNNGTSSLAASGVVGLGMMMEVVADAMGWQSRSDALDRVSLTLRSMAGETPGFQVPRTFVCFLFSFSSFVALKNMGIGWYGKTKKRN